MLQSWMDAQPTNFDILLNFNFAIQQKLGRKNQEFRNEGNLFEWCLLFLSTKSDKQLNFTFPI